MSGNGLRNLLLIGLGMVVAALIATGCLIQTDVIDEATVVTGPDDRTRAALAEPTAVPTPNADVESSETATVTTEAADAAAAAALLEAAGRDRDPAGSGAESPTAVPTAVATATPQPTALPRPTPTPAPSATAVPTVVPTATPEPTADATPTAEATATPDLLSYTDVRAATCPPGADDPSITCQVVTLPEDDENPADGRTVELFISVVDNDDAAGAGPTVILQGGPGVAIANKAEDYVGAGLDVILVDQRGVGLSTPSLDCTEYSGLFQTLVELGSDDPDRLATQIEVNRACRDRLVADGIRLEAFTSERNADDIALLRQVLGHDEWNVYGSSYGTRLALTLLRDHPEGIRTVVLDAVLPLEVDFFGELPANAERAITALDTACIEAVTCAQSYGDLTMLLDDAAAAFDAAPVTVAVTRPTSGDVVNALIDGAAVRSFVFDQMYLDEEIAALPARIALAASGDVEALASQVLRRQDAAALEFAEAMYWSVFCAEEVAFYDPATDDAVLARQPASFAVAHSAGDIASVCAAWDVPDAPATENESVTSDIPTLVFSGGFDPVTPPAWAQLVASTLGDAELVSLPRQSHGASNDCVGSILSAFLARPAEAPDTSCVDTSPIDFD